MRLAGTRRRLNDLAWVSSAAEEQDMCWAFELNQARLKAERRFRNIDVCLRTLQYADISHEERVRQAEVFSSNRSELLELLCKIRHLLAQQV
jgi:hypothetical protein